MSFADSDKDEQLTHWRWPMRSCQKLISLVKQRCSVNRPIWKLMNLLGYRQIGLLLSAGFICFPTCVFSWLYLKFSKRPVLATCCLLTDLQRVHNYMLFLLEAIDPLNYRPSPGVVFWIVLNKNIKMWSPGPIRTKSLFRSNFVHKFVYIPVSELFSFAKIIHLTGVTDQEADYTAWSLHRCTLCWGQGKATLKCAVLSHNTMPQMSQVSRERAICHAYISVQCISFHSEQTAVIL
jgi:hypothetical protein